MPELPEVETVVRGLRPLLVGKQITHIDVIVPRTTEGSPGKPKSVIGKTITNVSRIGKYIVITCDTNHGIITHLRMTGWLGLKTDLKHYSKSDTYVRLKIQLKDSRNKQHELVFDDVRKFGRVWFGRITALEQLPALQKLGPDALQVTQDDFWSRLHPRRGAIKSLILNQTFVAGVGNIYADESLFNAAIHPLAIPARLTRKRVNLLWACMNEVLTEAVARGGSTIKDYRQADGGAGAFQKILKVYGRAGEPCPRCAGIIQRTVIGQRGTWFCRKCQKR